MPQKGEMRSIKQPGYFLLIATIFILSCDVSTFLAPLPVPSPDPNLVQSIIVQTAARAGSQTAVLIIPTLTPTYTPFPSQTASTTPSPTETFVFILATPTNPKINWNCKLLAQAPQNGTSFAKNKSFTAKWTVQNIGDLAWIHTDLHIINNGGTLLAALSGYNTNSDVSPGASATLNVPMTAPSKSGSYTSKWTLRAKGTVFCPLSVSITVT
jgi:Ig-like domain from next to BRCA1 gene